MKTARVFAALLLLLAVAAPVAALRAAQNTAECCEPPSALSEVESKVSDLANAAGECPTADEAGLASARKDFAALFPKDAVQTEADVHGIRLTGTAEQLRFAQKIVSGDGTSIGSRRPSVWPSVAKDCTDLVCALAKLFGGEESALRALNVAKRTGYFITANQMQNPAGVEQIWRASEIRIIDEVTQKMPDHFCRLPTMKYFERVHDDYRDVDNPNTAAEASAGWAGGGGRIVVYAGAFSDGVFAAPAILHEIAHHLDFNGLIGVNLNQSTGFAKLSGWDKGKKQQVGIDKNGNPKFDTVYSSSRTDHFITDYARTSPFEDWADTAAYYVYAPELLKKVAPEKYALMKEKVFGGMEYQGEKWPELENAVKSVGGESALFQECLAHLAELAPNDEASVREIENREQGYVFWRGRPLEQFPLQTRCLKKVADEIARTLKTDPSFCDRGGVLAIEGALRRKIMWLLRSVLSAAIEAAKPTVKLAEKRCFENNDFTRACAISKDAIRAALLTNAEFSALPETARSEAGERILNLVRPADRIGPIVKAFTPGRTLQACLTGVDVIRVSKDGVRYLTDTTTWTEAISELRLAKSCTSNLQKQWRASGFTLDSDANDLAVLVIAGKAIDSIANAFEKEVLLLWPEKLQACADPATRQSCMEGVLKSWAEKQKLGAEFGSGALIERLLKTVKAE